MEKFFSDIVHRANNASAALYDRRWPESRDPQCRSECDALPYQDHANLCRLAQWFETSISTVTFNADCSSVTQIVDGVRPVIAATESIPMPRSRAKDFGDFIAAHPAFQDAIVVADPDYLMEALPYYAPNPTYLLHEPRWGNAVKFTSHARIRLTLDDVLSDARRLQDERKQSVLILLLEPLDRPIMSELTYHFACHWDLSITREQIIRFRDATQLLARLGRAQTDESYNVYMLKKTDRGSVVSDRFHGSQIKMATPLLTAKA
jgi:hypothetical protein